MILILACSKNKEPVPFYDGLYFVYQFEDTGTTTRYTIKVLDNNKFLLVNEDRFTKPEPDESFVDSYGREDSGEFSPIWIPVNKMEIGDTFGDIYSIASRVKWKNWDVMVVKIFGVPIEQYHEVNTGFLVGQKTSAL